jgi:2,4-dienoyl-CoA reductase-like NADH-dependent reductase (Old Yellow Enzyme family)
MLISGHVMIDRVMKASTRDPVLDEKSNLESFKSYAKAATKNNTKCILQINHPGRQWPAACSKPVAPSAVALKKYNFIFKKPRALTEHEIEEIIDKFTYTAVKSKECGFHEIELHAAHGYLLSQFLNLVVNQRRQMGEALLKIEAALFFKLLKILERKEALYCWNKN